MDDSESSTSGFMRSVPEHKTRRPHKKSRFGCAKCKARRIKCDEGTPRCSRCERMDLTCVYRKKKDQNCRIDTLEFSRADWGLHVGRVVSPASSSQSVSPPLSAGSPLSSSSSPDLPPPSRGVNEHLPLIWLAAQTLVPAELELFHHYLEHTSRDPSVVDEDVYTLQVGIPTLACQSKPLMRSVLALAAVCQCSDIIKQSSTCSASSRHDRERVAHLLSVGHRYHLESLREIQETLHEATNYDHVLANAAMMGMYGSGSHCARIWLAKTATPDHPPLSDLMPEYPQWMSLFRAVRLAYAGLLNNSNPPTPPDSAQSTYEHKTSPSCAIQHARTPTDHPLRPILAATIEPAMARLHDKAAEVLATHDNSNPDLQACLSALSILDSIVAATFPANNTSNTCSTRTAATQLTTTGTRTKSSPETAPDPSRLSHLSPWLRHYTASITSIIPSHLPRRTIMSFVHKAPTAYLTLIEDMLGLIQTTAQGKRNGKADSMSASSAGTCSSSDSDSDTASELSAAHHLALEVFAHWLVLVMLLDDVWWIGGIGAWELGRVVALRRDGKRLSEGARAYPDAGDQADGEWWPEGMWEVAMVFERFKNR